MINATPNTYQYEKVILNRLLSLLFLCSFWPGMAQLVTDIPEDVRNQQWDAKWITCPGINGSEYGVYYFRKDITLTTVPDRFVVHVSADNRYKLYVNGQYISQGPATGDLMKWRYDSYDLSSYLRPGNNTIAATVWNFAEYRPVFQASQATGFILQGAGPLEAVIVSMPISWGFLPIPSRNLSRQVLC